MNYGKNTVSISLINRKRCPDKERGGGFLLLSEQGSVKAVDKAISSYLGITVNKYYLVNIHISW